MKAVKSLFVLCFCMSAGAAGAQEFIDLNSVDGPLDVDVSITPCYPKDSNTLLLDYVFVGDKAYWTEIEWNETKKAFVPKSYGLAGSDHIRIYRAEGVYRGDWGAGLSNTEKRDKINEICELTRPIGYSSVVGFVSIYWQDELVDFPDLYAIPTNVPVLGGPNDIVIADRWVFLLDGDINASLLDAGVVDIPWWSGSDPYGVAGSGGETCNGWSFIGSDNGYMGEPDDVLQEWVSGSGGCDEYKRFLCLAF